MAQSKNKKPKRRTAAEQDILGFNSLLNLFYTSYKKSPTALTSSTARIVDLVNNLLTPALITDQGITKATTILDAFDQWKKVYGTNSTLTAEGVVQLALWQKTYLLKIVKQIQDDTSK